MALQNTLILLLVSCVRANEKFVKCIFCVHMRCHAIAIWHASCQFIICHFVFGISHFSYCHLVGGQQATRRWRWHWRMAILMHHFIRTNRKYIHHIVANNRSDRVRGTVSHCSIIQVSSGRLDECPNACIWKMKMDSTIRATIGARSPCTRTTYGWNIHFHCHCTMNVLLTWTQQTANGCWTACIFMYTLHRTIKLANAGPCSELKCLFNFHVSNKIYILHCLRVERHHRRPTTRYQQPAYRIIFSHQN